MGYRHICNRLLIVPGFLFPFCYVFCDWGHRGGVWGAEDQMQGMLPLFCVALCQHSGSRSNPRVSLIFWFSSLCLCSRVSLAASSHK